LILAKGDKTARQEIPFFRALGKTATLAPCLPKVPTFDQLMNPLITALRDLGGSGSIDEIYERVIQNLKFSEDILSVLHDPRPVTKPKFTTA
jgi:hypothetical protein